MAKGRKSKKDAGDDDIIENDPAAVVGDQHQSDEEAAESAAPAACGKAGKKAKRKKKDDDFEDVTKELEELSLEYEGKKPVPAAAAAVAKNEAGTAEEEKKSKKKKKKPKETIEDEEEQDDESGQATKVKGKSKATIKKSREDEDPDSRNDLDDGEVTSPAKASKKKAKKKSGKSVFEMLTGGDSDEIPSEDGEDLEEEKPAPKKGKEKSKEGKKASEVPSKKGKKKKGRGDEDEDIDKVLAELGIEISAKPADEDSQLPEDIAVKTEDNPDKEADLPEASTVEDEEKKPKPAKDGEQPEEDEGEEEEESEVAKKKRKPKKKKGTAGASAAADDKKAGPGKKALAAMQETLKKLHEDEERQKQEEELEQKRMEELESKRLEKLRLEQERRERKKQKDKEKKERLKSEGKFLTGKQKVDRERAQAMIQAMKEQGLDIVPAEKRVKPGTRIRPSKKQKEEEASAAALKVETTEESAATNAVDGTMPKEDVDEAPESWDQEPDDVKESWEEPKKDEEEESDGEESSADEAKPEHKAKPSAATAAVTENGKEESESESETESESEESDESESDKEEVKKTDADIRKENALMRIQKRREEAEKNRNFDDLRAAVVCVLGHVDTGKTKILDKLRRTNVQDGEAGGITQQIGATNVPIENIKEQCRFVKKFSELSMKLPGLLIIDTPGHESFSNLRSRGSSLCDIAILVIDIMHGLEPQTIESINLLKSRKTPFVVALNKIDRLYDWVTTKNKDIEDVIKAQSTITQQEFERRTKEIIVQLAEQGLNAALCYKNPDRRSYISLMPTSAFTGEGMGNLLSIIVELCETMLVKRLAYSSELHATVLEVKAIPGLGTTIDIILVNGTIREGDTAIIAGTEGPIVTQIRSLLMPQPMKELRVKNAYIEYKEVKAARGVKVAAKDLEKSIAGLNLLVAHQPDEVEICKAEVSRELKSALSSVKLKEKGVYVQASTLGSLEALLEFLRTSSIPYCGIRIGPVVKRDVMKCSAMLEHDAQFAVILAFDVRIEKDAQDMADNLGVKIFQADIIYHLFDKFMAYREELKQKKREEFKSIAVFPCKLKILPQFVFNSRDPIVVGVMIEAGILKEGTPICVPSKEFLDIGVVTSLEVNHKATENARKGQEVCIKIDPIPGESPKMFGRHFDEKDILVSKISRTSIDVCKEHFRDDLLKSDWQVMLELKKIFQIM